MRETIFEQQAIRYLKEELTKKESEAFESVIDSDIEKKQIFEDIKTIYTSTVNDVSMPDDSLRDGFYAMLFEFQEKENKQTFLKKIQFFFTSQISKEVITQYTLRAAIILLSFFIGLQWDKGNSSEERFALSTEITRLNNKITSLQLKSSSASDRILAVNNLNSSNLQEEKIIHNLINKLHHDENLHVRITAAKSLVLFKHSQLVKSAILDAVRTEKELFVKASLIDALIEIDKGAALEEIYRAYENENSSEDEKKLYKKFLKTKSI